jgi:hypothetical protein
MGIDDMSGGGIEKPIKTQEDVVELMRGSKSEKEWNANCDKVKKAFGNKYPDFWYGAVIVSGVAKESQDKWSK